MTKLTEYETLALHKLGESIHNGKWSNEGMVQLIELINHSERIKQTNLNQTIYRNS